MEKKLNSLIISFFVLTTLSVVMFAAVSVLGVIYENPAELIEETEDSELAVLGNPTDPTLASTNDFGQKYIDKIIFLGESTTYGLQRYGVLTGGEQTVNVWTGAATKNGRIVSAGTMSLSPTIASTRIFYPDNGTALTVSEAVKLKAPEYLVITLGLNNGASYYSERDFKHCYRLLLDSILAAGTDTKIILQSIFPVSRRCEIKAYTPKRLDECNSWVRDLAEEYGIKYLNTAETLRDDDGYLLEEYNNGGDGVHLNKQGLEAVIFYIRTHGYGEIYEN